MRSCRPHGGAAQDLAILNYRVRLICPLAQGCSPVLWTRQRDICKSSASSLPGTRSATAFGGALARATGLASYLSGYSHLARQRCGLSHRRCGGWFSRPSSGTRGHPSVNPGFVPPFGGFRPEGRYRPIFGPHRADNIVATSTLWVTMTGFSPGAGSNPHSIA